MATNKSPTKAEFLEALSKKGIKTLEDLVDAVMPEPDETGGYGSGDTGPYNAADILATINKYQGNVDLVGLGHALSGAFYALYASVYLSPVPDPEDE